MLMASRLGPLAGTKAILLLLALVTIQIQIRFCAYMFNDWCSVTDTINNDFALSHDLPPGPVPQTPYRRGGTSMGWVLGYIMMMLSVIDVNDFMIRHAGGYYYQDPQDPPTSNLNRYPGSANLNTATNPSHPSWVYYVQWSAGVTRILIINNKSVLNPGHGSSSAGPSSLSQRTNMRWVLADVICRGC